MRNFWRLIPVIGFIAGVALIAQGPITPIANLRGRTDSNGNLYISNTSLGSGQGPLTPIGNLGGRTDSSGNLLVNCSSGCGGTGTINAGAANDLPCYSASTTLGPCETGIATYSSHNLSIPTLTASTAVTDGANYYLQGNDTTFFNFTTLWTSAAKTTRGTFNASQVASVDVGGSYVNLNASANGIQFRFGGASNSLTQSNSTTLAFSNDASARSFVASGSAPSITGCSTSAQTGGNTIGTFTSGTTGTCGPTLTFALTAPTGWNCFANDITTAADYAFKQASSTTTTAVFSSVTVSGDVIKFACFAY